MKQAVLRRGVPKRLFVDNGAAFRDHHHALVAAQMYEVEAVLVDETVQFFGALDLGHAPRLGFTEGRERVAGERSSAARSRPPAPV